MLHRNSTSLKLSVCVHVYPSMSSKVVAVLYKLLINVIHKLIIQVTSHQNLIG